MEQISTEKFIEQLGAELYPITIVKFLLNKRKILSYFKKAESKKFEIRIKYEVDPSTCKSCEEKKDENILCRQHTSIQRVLNAKTIAVDLDTNVYFYKNEIFKMVNNRLVIIYCPHPKLITGDISDSKVRKINTITIEDEKLLGLPVYNGINPFLSSTLLDKNLKCWFNKEFSILTIPKDRDSQDWCLISNK